MDGVTDNIIPVHLRPEIFTEINTAIHRHGVKRVEDHLLSLKFHPSYVKCMIRKVLRMRGGIK